MKNQKFCLFCTGKGMTKEHFWPDWISPFLNKSGFNSYKSDFYLGEGKGPQQLIDRKEKPGSLFTKKLRVVCGNCNNGWMSRLETQLKPVLLALLEKKSLRLGPVEQNLLSKWISMKVMVAEQAQVETRVTPDLDLKEFCKNQEIPSYFTVYIGRHTSGVHTWFSRYTATFSLKKDRYDPPLNGLTKNSQSVTFLIGPLVVHVLASRVSGFDLGGEFKYPTLNRIWPMEINELEWPFIKVTTENGIGAIANSFDGYLKAPGVTYGGPLRKE